MIFLIDDNKYGQMSANYKVDFTATLQSFPESIKWYQVISESDIEIVSLKASCVLIHDSVEPKELKEKLVAIARIKNIPYCIFSNGFAATIYDGESICEIKKDRLYNNLIIFIDQFEKERKIDLNLLSLGQNYESEKASIIQDRLINGILLKYKNRFDYEIAFPSGSSQYKDLRELVYLSNPSIDFSDFEEMHNAETTTALVMRDLIIDMAKNVRKKYE